MSQKKNMTRMFQNLAWCKPDWCLPSMSKETNELLRQCTDLPETDVSEDLEQVMERSKAFPIPFPIETVRLHTLKDTRPIERLQRNISSTYPVIHERVLLLMTHFLVYKREFGSSIEKVLYKDMTVPELIDRLFTKRAATFVGAHDRYLLITGEEGAEGWESVGTPQQRPPLVLDSCLSYDEIKLSSLLYTSGWTECINDGDRKNAGHPGDDIEEEAVIIGTVGPRFSRAGRMECEEVLITAAHSSAARGYGEAEPPTSCLYVLRNTYPRDRHMWRHIWADLYQVPSFAYEELSPLVGPHVQDAKQNYTDRYVRLRDNKIFDNEVYYKRIAILAECALLEADRRAEDHGTDAYLNVIGCGLGVWKISSHQNDVYVLTFLERIQALLKEGRINHIADVNFAFIDPSSGVKELFIETRPAMSGDEQINTLFFESTSHPRDGVRVWLERRTPSSRLREPRLLVMTCAGDPNSFPGNEFWMGSLTTSGDPATACSTQVSELHNALVNRGLRGSAARVISRDGVLTLPVYCRRALDSAPL